MVVENELFAFDADEIKYIDILSMFIDRPRINSCPFQNRPEKQIFMPSDSTPSGTALYAAFERL